MAEILLAISDVCPQSNGAVIAVRICDDADLEVGDVLTRLQGPSRRFDSTTRQIVRQDPSQVDDVSLQVQWIEAYGKRFTRLNVGMTCSLLVVGRGVELLEVGMELCGDVDRSGHDARLA